MTWDALAALGIVAGAVVLLLWQTLREKRVCDKCDVVTAQRRVQGAGVTRKPTSALRIGERLSR